MSSVPKHTLNIPIVILAAGASKRMGTIKQLLSWGEHTLLGHAIQTALKTNTKDIYVVLGANYRTIKKEIDKFPVTIIKNDAWELGLGKSIACAVDHILQAESHVEGILICLADQPFVDTDFLNTLIQNFVPNKNKIVATSYKNGFSGVPVIFDKAYASELSKLIDDNGAKSLLRKYTALVDTFKLKLDNIDIDNKEDYDHLYKVNFKN
ncbi:nucleotidyltransferase family protein [Flavivirga abyssicola]|uniref:nucleotidyltransferase family protein n=1 Tax=Flavivirga abyssicola TaxID=3063533 RepID=UPI0026E0D9BF|nr:nucleotidyltransferase family protein [Flavivirga sp. MEBiC07777]WVK13277.1 nucleotidyltransferase family protein [Flavivirga sp. MEBiC07777]